MKTVPPSRPALDLPTNLDRQLVYTLTSLLPPPIDDSPEALQARNHAAILKVAALLPVDANEVDLAAQCIAARAQAEDLLRLVRQHAGDIALVMRLNAQYASMVRTSLSVHGRLMRVQAVRRKRESIDGAASADAWARDNAELTMLKAAFQDAEPSQPIPQAAPPDQSAQQDVPEDGKNSQKMAFETWMREQPWTLGSTEPSGTALRAAVRQAMAGFRSPGQEANSRESPEMAS